jgi:hypothetical protein
MEERWTDDVESLEIGGRISVTREGWWKILEKSELSLDCCADGGEVDEFHMR